jgi:hypothetical protein
MYTISIVINPTSPAQFAEYLAILASHKQPTTIAIRHPQPQPAAQDAAGCEQPTRDRQLPPFHGTSNPDEVLEYWTLHDAYVKAHNDKGMRRTQEETASGLSRLQVFRAWHDGKRADPTPAQPAAQDAAAAAAAAKQAAEEVELF